MSAADTIFALSSGRGIAGVAVLRVSGPAARLCLERIAGGCPEPRRASLRMFADPASGEIIDRGLALWFPGPASFTGEDMAELQVHGSRAVMAALAEALGRFARAAEPGEFTRRAFLAGRLDLVEAEGLSDLLAARTRRQRLQAWHHLSGGASRIYEEWRSRLIGLLGRVEAAVDFGEEADVAAAALRGVAAGCEALVTDLRVALAEEKAGRSVREGLVVVLAGLPNTGKSSLLNALARREAAIVSPQPGTTRDIVEVEIALAGVPVLFRDTAGLREQSGDTIEREGMARARRAMQEADLTLWVSSPDIAGSDPSEEFDSATFWIENKSDLGRSGSIRPGNEPGHRVSAVTGAGMATLLRDLEREIESLCAASEMPTVVRARHAQAISASVIALERALQAMTGDRVELIAEELRCAARCLERVTGRIEVEDLLDSIFKSFCIGK